MHSLTLAIPLSVVQEPSVNLYARLREKVGILEAQIVPASKSKKKRKREREREKKKSKTEITSYLRYLPASSSPHLAGETAYHCPSASFLLLIPGILGTYSSFLCNR